MFGYDAGVLGGVQETQPFRDAIGVIRPNLMTIMTNLQLIRIHPAHISYR